MDNGIFFGKQTIQNACGTQAILNVLLNCELDNFVDLGTELNNFKQFVVGFDGEMTGETISNSELIRTVHNSFSAPPFLVDEVSQPSKTSDDKNDGIFHFIGYIPKNGKIFEFDGLKSFPIVHGDCHNNLEFIDKIPKVLMERIAKYGQELRFSCLVVTNDKLQEAISLGDKELESFELRKRLAWDKEIELRKHDYTNLLVNMIRKVSEKSTDEEWDELLKNGHEKSKRFYNI